ncbi:MAG TPA: hypothetical protein VH439_16030, partial [Gemmatimonadales bacterium]
MAAGCVALALAYLPPRGAEPSGRHSFLTQAPRPTPARARAQALAEDWRRTDGTLRLLTSRRHLQELARAASARGSSLVVTSEASSIADSAAHVAWRQLGLGETKVQVALVLEWAKPTPGDRPRGEEARAWYLAPDSTDRTTCVAVVTLNPYWARALAPEERSRVPFADLVQTLKVGFGPCAFYAAYGTPGKPVRAWLTHRGWDLGLVLGPGRPRPGGGSSLITIAQPGYPWYWKAVYSAPPAAVACLAGRFEGCRVAVLSGTSDDPTIPFPDILRMDRRWWLQPQLVEGQRFLGDVARAVGRDRFQTFWTSTQPVDTALATALKRPVGEWTAEWQRTLVAPVRLGPTVPMGNMALAFAIAAAAMLIVTLTASRRQVR